MTRSVSDANRGFIGVLMLDTNFDRIPGDVGNASSYPYPTRFLTIPDADPTQVVKAGKPSASLIDAFCIGAKTLRDQGAVGIVSSCGFLINAQHELAASVDIPVMASSLVMAPSLLQKYGNRPVGIITANANALDSGALRAAGLSPDQAVVRGLQDEPAFAKVFLAEKNSSVRRVDKRRIGSAAAAAARSIVEQCDQTGVIVVECGNLPPYRQEIQAAAQRPVIDILDCAAHMWHDREAILRRAMSGKTG